MQAATASSTLSRYLDEMQREPLLTPQRERELALSASRGDTESRNDLVLSNLRFVVTVAGQFRHCGIPLEELINEGNLGLIEAARRFDPTRQVKFITYAGWWIRKYIRTLVEHSHVVRIPRYRLRLVRESRERKPSTGSGSTSGFLDALATHGLRAISVDDERGAHSLADNLTRPGQHDPEQALLLADASLAVSRCLELLTARQRRVIRARYGLAGRPVGTLRSIGLELGLSRERVRQIEGQAMARLRQLLRSRLPGRGSTAPEFRKRSATPGKARGAVTRSSSIRHNVPVHSGPVKNPLDNLETRPEKETAK